MFMWCTSSLIMNRAHDKAIQDIRYDFRPNKERARKVAENKRRADATHPESANNNTNPPDNSKTCEIKPSIFTMERAAAVVTQSARFCGHVERSNPERHRLKDYNVYRLLTYAETRIALLKIQSGNEKIKEALLLVSTDGSAHSALNGEAFQGIRTFNEFKAERVDKLANIHKFINTRREKEC